MNERNSARQCVIPSDESLGVGECMLQKLVRIGRCHAKSNSQKGGESKHHMIKNVHSSRGQVLEGLANA